MFKKIFIEGEETCYSVDENGRVRNDTTGKFLKGCILHSYHYIAIRWKGKQKNISAHRLVAEAFLPNPDNLPYVHHIDGDRLNNNVNNLQWVSIKENNQAENKKISKEKEEYSQNNIEGEEWRYFRDTNYMISNKGRIKNVKTGRISLGGIEDCGYRRFKIKFSDGTYKRIFVHRLVYETFISPNYNLINHINGNKLDNRVENLENVTHQENMWKAAYETKAWNYRPVAQYDSEGNFIQLFPNASAAGRAMGILPSSMRNCIRLREGRHKNYIFRYIEIGEEAPSAIPIRE